MPLLFEAKLLALSKMAPISPFHAALEIKVCFFESNNSIETQICGDDSMPVIDCSQDVDDLPMRQCQVSGLAIQRTTFRHFNEELWVAVEGAYFSRRVAAFDPVWQVSYRS